jgi:hypothetical protein
MPIRIAATFIKFRRWTTALMKCVVPITTASTVSRGGIGATPSGRRECRMSHPCGRTFDSENHLVAIQQHGVGIGAADVNSNASHQFTLQRQRAL